MPSVLPGQTGTILASTIGRIYAIYVHVESATRKKKKIPVQVEPG